MDPAILQNPADRERLRIELDRELGKRSLARFMRKAWPIVEPNELRWNWHLDAMAEHLEAVSRGQIRKLLINVPPGLSKSLTVATFWPAWDWIERPTRRFIFATYGQDLSDKNAVLHRDLVMADWYRARWPHVEIGKDSTKKVREFHNTSRGWRFSTSVGGQVTGRHGDILVFDDLVKAQDSEGRAVVDPVAIEKANDFWFKTMSTRRADPQTTAYVGIMQRLHHEDAAAKCIAQGDYVHLCLPMEFEPARKCIVYVRSGSVFSPPPEDKRPKNWTPPEGSEVFFEDPRTEKGELLNAARFPAEVVSADRAAMGSLTFEAQMQQNPTPRTGGVFKLDWMRRWTEVPAGARCVITADCSFKDKESSDFVAIQCWAVKNPHYYLIDELHGKWNVKATMDRIREMRRRHRTAIGIYVEDKANGPAIMQILGDEVPGLIAWSPGTASKVSRAEAVAPLFEAGNVWIPPDDRAPWAAEYITEMIRFPMSRNDDRVDATSMALLILHRPKHRRYKEAVRNMRGG